MIDQVYFFDFPDFLQRLQMEGKLIHFPFFLRRTMEERCWYWNLPTGRQAPIIVIKLPRSALFIQLCCVGCGARPRSNWTTA